MCAIFVSCSAQTLHSSWTKGGSMRIFFFSCLLFLSSCLASPPHAQLRGELAPTQNRPSLSSSEASSLKIWIPYVGQGDATLIQTPQGKTLLIDAGPPEAGATILLPFLRNLGLSRLDALLITHYDRDHLGGVPGLLAGEDGKFGTADDINVTNDYDRGGQQWDDSPGLLPYLEALNSLNIPRNILEAGQEISLDPELRIQCKAVNGIVQMADGDFLSVDLTPTTYTGQENASSAALLLQFKDFRYLTAGDLTGGGSPNGFLTPDIETPLADAVGEVDVLHVNHHGSLSSSNPHYVEMSSPEAVFIQAGKDNPYGHPAFEVVKRWKDAGAWVLSTAEEQGYVLISDGDNFRIEVLENEIKK
jgi:competence protein ComEC